MIFTEQTLSKCIDNLHSLNAVLFFQTNFGLALEMSKRIQEQFVCDEVVILDFQDIEKHFAQTLKEQLCDGFFATRKIIKVYNFKPTGKSKLKEELKFLNDNKIIDKLILLFAPDLDGKATIKTFFEKGDFTASIACYNDDEQTAVDFIDNFFKSRQIVIEKQAVKEMASMLHGDRKNLISECEKIMLYTNNCQITIEDVNKAIINEQVADPGACIDGLLSGQLSKALQEFELCEKEDIQMILFARLFMRSVEEALDIKNMLSNGTDIDAAIKAKFIFWKRIPLVKLAVIKNTISMLENYIKIALQVERMAKIYGNDIAKYYFIRNIVFYSIK